MEDTCQTRKEKNKKSALGLPEEPAKDGSDLRLTLTYVPDFCGGLYLHFRVPLTCL